MQTSHLQQDKETDVHSFDRQSNDEGTKRQGMQRQHQVNDRCMSGRSVASMMSISYTGYSTEGGTEEDPRNSALESYEDNLNQKLINMTPGDVPLHRRESVEITTQTSLAYDWSKKLSISTMDTEDDFEARQRVAPIGLFTSKDWMKISDKSFTIPTDSAQAIDNMPPLERRTLDRFSSKDWMFSDKSMQIAEDLSQQVCFRDDGTTEDDPDTSALCHFQRSSARDAALFFARQEHDAASSSSSDEDKSEHENPGTFVVPNETDILFGRGGQANNHPGNFKYRVAVEWKKRAYQDVRPRKAKQQIVRDVIDHFLNKGTRFLMKNKTAKNPNEKWIIAPEEVMFRKVSQALREKEKSTKGEP